jgi:carbamate kinase
LLILTDVDFAYSDFGTPEQKELTKLTVAEAEALMEGDHFHEGSMKPKIHASLQFLRGDYADESVTPEQLKARRVLITSLHKATSAMDGEFGTEITW